MARDGLVARRRQLGLSQADLAALNVAVSTIARTERNESTPQAYNRHRWATALEVTLVELDRLLDDDPPIEDLQRREVLKIGLAAVLAEAATEAISFTSRAAASSVGQAALNHLEMAVASIARSYSRRPPHEVLSVALTYRRRVDEMLSGRRTLREARELYVCAAWLSENLAWLTHDLGGALAADAYCVDAHEHAYQAGHDELCAWAMDAKASIAMYNERPADARDAALRGLAIAPAGHPLTVRLHAQAARASARLGQRGDFEEALAAARNSFDRLPSRTPDRFGKDTTKLAAYAVTSYAATSYLWLDRPAEALLHAEAALVEHHAAADRDRSPSRDAIARIDLAACHATNGEPEEAARLGVEALTSPRVVESVRIRAADLDATMQRTHPQIAETAGFREALLAAREDQRP